MGYGEVDQAEAVEDTNQDHQGTLPEEPIEGDTQGGEKPKDRRKIIMTVVKNTFQLQK